MAGLSNIFGGGDYASGKDADPDAASADGDATEATEENAQPDDGAPDLSSEDADGLLSGDADAGNPNEPPPT